MLEPKDIETFKAAILSAKTIFISAHVGPDGDTLGSMLGLKHSLKAHFSHLTTIHTVISGKMPDIYTFMPGIDGVEDVQLATDLLPQYDLAFSVDCGSAERLGPAKPHFLNALTSINIDHHISNSRFGKVNIIDAHAGASGEVVADLLNANHIPIPREAAIALYVAILTDTGGFKYASTSAKIFDLAAALTRLGADPELIYRRIYEKCPISQAMLQADALINAKFNAEKTLCWTVITQALMKRYAAREEHIEGMVETLRRIDSVKVSAVLRETQEGKTKVSLRSDVQDINVSDIMTRWDGGGHKMAAGCNMDKPIFEAEQELIPYLEAAVSQASGIKVPSA